MASNAQAPTQNQYPKGSEWRRWDLHVHTPSTALEDDYTGWEPFVAALKAEKQVRVLGVTDYLSIENYTKLLDIRNREGLGTIELLIPNIEFRIAPRTKSGSAVNLHLLIDPSSSDHVESINAALFRLSVEYDGQPYSCVPKELRRLGAAYKPNLSDDRSKLREGINQFKIDFSTFRVWLEKEEWLLQNCLVAISAGEDGPSGVKGGGWGAVREEMWRFADIVFSGNPQNREYWLGSDPNAVKMGAPKPCIHGSDAHSLEKLFKPNENRLCWIKADPTFEGLRQILFEPEERVHIGQQPPTYHDAARVIADVTLNDKARRFFPSSAILLNEGLISIIGPKGSGKSALTDLLSYATGAPPKNDKSSFLFRAYQYIQGIEIAATWRDGTPTKATIGEISKPQQRVRYLSQSFVERLCSEDYAGTDLTNEIESVIFGHLDPTDTLNASSFSELRDLRTQDTERERIEIAAKIKSFIAEDEQLRQTIKTIPDKKNRIAELGKEKESLDNQLPKAATEAEAQAQEQAAVLRGQLSRVQGQVASLKQMVVATEHLQSQLQRFRSSFSEFRREFLRSAGAVGLTEGVVDVEFRVVGESAISDRKSELESQIAALEGRDSSAATQEPTIAQLTKDIATTENAIATDRARKLQVQQIQKRIAASVQEIQRLQAEVLRIETETVKRLKTLREERLAAYEGLFRSWQKELQILARLYGPVQEKLAGGEKEEQQLDFYIKWDIDLESWLERGANLIDHRKAHPFGSPNDLRDAVQRLLVPGWGSGDPSKVRQGMDDFLQLVKDKNVEASLKGSITHSLLLEWIFDVSHIRLSYGLRYNDTELDKLSPGTKGIVLLILYLAMDVDDSRPLIVDQPEENLDSESIYLLLARYFRKAKQRRQVIVITHNPNLVVNTDAEQVIIASADRHSAAFPTFSYASGSLENPVIRKSVCSLLEGGEKAFLERERRYALSRKS